MKHNVQLNIKYKTDADELICIVDTLVTLTNRYNIIKVCTYRMTELIFVLCLARHINGSANITVPDRSIFQDSSVFTNVS